MAGAAAHRMTLASLIRVSAGLALAAALTTGPASAGRQGVTEVGLRVTVSDESSRYLTGLDAGNFSVSEADAEQQVISVTPLGDVPVSYTLLLDTSNSLEERLARAQAVAIDLVRRLGAQDAASVYAFNNRIVRVQDFTGDAARLERAIGSARRNGATALHHALYVTLKELQTLAARDPAAARRHAMVVLSDGVDTASLITYETVRDLARAADVTLYAVGLDSAYSRGQSRLGALAEETGGRAFAPRGPDDLSAIGGQIVSDLAGQYLLRYVPSDPPRDGGWRRVDVRVDVPGATVRAKRGYFGPRTR